MDNLNSINNNGVPYYFKADIAKEGGQYVRLSNFFKARVGDNGKVLPFKWYDQGRVMNVHGYIPFIQGLIGKFSTDDNDEVIMASDASYREWQGSTANAHDGGFIDYILEDQMFPQEGIFKGHFGLKDGNGNVLTSVNIIFEVLGNDLRVGETVKYYVGELENLKNQYKIQGEQAVKDFNAKIEAGTEANRAALNALSASIQANRDEQANLTNQLKGTQQQIEINDIVKKTDFAELSRKINEQLSHMNFKPDYYVTYQDMVAKNPQGSHNACVTTDNYHVWLYDYDLKQWKDGGQISNYGLDEQSKAAVATPNPDNLVYDPDFKLSDTWIAGGHTNPLVASVSRTHRIQGSNAMMLTDTGGGGSFTSQDINATGITQISYGAMINLTGAVGTAFMSIWGRSDTSDYPISRMELKNDNDDKLHLQKSEFCLIPEGTNTIRIAFELSDQGTMTVVRPQINVGNKLYPYSLGSIAEEWDYDPNEDNLITRKNLTNFRGFSVGENLSLSIVKDPKFNNSDVAVITNPTTNEAAFTTPRVENKLTTTTNLNFGFWLKTTTNVGLRFWWDYGDKNGSYAPDFHPKTDGEWHFYKVENMLLNPSVKNFRADIAFVSQGTIEVARPQFNYGNGLLPYSATTIQKYLNDQILPVLYSNNLIADNEFKSKDYWLSETKGKAPQVSSTYDITCDANVLSLTSIDQVVTYRTPDFKVGNHKFVDLSILASTTKSNDNTYIGVWNDQGKCLFGWRIPESSTLKKLDELNIYIPEGTNTIRLALTVASGGSLKAALPKLTFGKRYTNDLPIMDISTAQSIGDKSITAPFIFKNKENVVKGYTQISIQGDSSRGFEKKNYKIKTYQDEACTIKLKWQPKASWNKNNKFNLKANWIDATQSRNLVNARIFERATIATPFENSNVAEKLSKAQGMGQMEGMPIELYIGGKYAGLYTLNTKKDDKTFGMDSDNVGEEAITFETVGSNLRTYPAKLDGSDYATVVQDTPTPELKTNFNNFLQFLNTASEQDLRSNLKTYIDVHSVMNTYLWGVLAYVWDTSAKSNLLLTYDNGKYFYMIPYDMDSTWGLKPDGSINKLPLPEYDFANIDNDNYMQFVTEKKDMKIFNIMYQYFKPELKAQYQYLRQNVWSNAQIIDEFKKFINSIPQAVYDREHTRWPNVPSYGKADFAQLQQAVVQRGAKMDKFMEGL